MDKNFSKLKNIILTIFNNEKKKIEPNTKLKSFKKFDSLNHLNLIFLIQKKFNIKLTLKEIENSNTVGDLHKNITKKI